MKLHDRLLGLITVAGGVALVVSGWRFPPTPGQIIGAGHFPVVVGVVLILGGLALAHAARGVGGPLIRLPGWMRERAGAANVALIAGAIVFYLAASTRLGFVPTAFLIVTAITWRLGARPVPALATGIALALALHLLFGEMLRVALPRGLLAGWL
jgi:putative tricarboxylic transport membrane protein